MKRIVLVAVIILAAVSLARPADATPRGSFGMGIIVGEPTGLDLKWFLNDVNAIEGAVAWSFSGDTDVHIQVDYLYHFYDWIKVKKGLLPVFFGIGGRVAFRENQDDKLGVRIPVGLSYEFDGGVVDVFGELVPVLDLAPDTDFDFEGAIGARFWF
jgi:opacity protein-like surface antigen